MVMATVPGWHPTYGLRARIAAAGRQPDRTGHAVAATTALILVGHPHPYDGGIIPTHLVQLCEGSRPVWVLSRIGGPEADPLPPVRWVPTGDHPLEDALLLIGLHAIRDEDLLLLAGRLAPEVLDTRVDLGQVLTGEQLDELRSVWRRLEGGTRYKLVVTALDGSLVRSEVGALAHYAMEVELCLPVFSRWTSTTSGETVVTGGLDRP
jgi:hypothetical protein